MAGKRGNGEGSIFRYGKKWRASISVIGPDGNRVRKTKTCATRADAVAELEQLRVQAKTPLPEVDPTTVSRWMETWLENGRLHWAKATHDQRRYAIDKWIAGEVGFIRLAALTAQDVRNLLSSIQTKGASGRVMQIVRSTLMAACNAAVHDDRLVVNPVLKVKTPAAAREEIQPFTEEEVRQIFTETRESRYHAAYVLAFLCGLRIGELLGLRWTHVDLEAGKLRVEEQLIDNRGHLERSRPKTAASRRTIDLTPTGIAALQNHRAILLKEGNIACEEVFPSRHGTPTRRTNFVRREWEPLLKRLGLAHRGFHHTRHTYATLALRRGVVLPVVSAVLGHSSQEITLRVYSHFMPGDQRMSVEAMESLAAGGSSVAIDRKQKSS